MATSLRRLLHWTLLSVIAVILTAYHLVWLAFVFAGAAALLIVGALRRIREGEAS